VPIFVPPVCLYGIERAGMMPRNAALRTTLELSLIAGELYIAAPLGVAIYPQLGKVNAEELEQEFKNIRNEHGDIIRVFQFNKGI
jgi:hypothetical protein